jgi:PAS domain-containing protein
MAKPLEWPSRYHKAKEEELRLKLLETVIVKTKDSIIITEANLNERQLPKIVYVNPAFSLMTGYSHEIIGQSPDLLKALIPIKIISKKYRQWQKKKV